MFLQQRSLLTKFDQTKLLQILITVTMVAGIGAQQIYFELSSTRFEPHPIASLLGRLAPLLVIAPVGYWMMGRMLRRNFMRRRMSSLTPSRPAISSKRSLGFSLTIHLSALES